MAVVPSPSYRICELQWRQSCTQFACATHAAAWLAPPRKGTHDLPPHANGGVQFKLEVEEVDDAAHELAKYRSDVTLPVVIQVC